jgi:hypothetical protein
MITTRTLCTLLAEALDALTPVERRVLVAAAKEDRTRAKWFARLLDGLVMQSAFDELRRQAETAAVLAPFEADAARELEALALEAFGPLPQRADGIEWRPEG